MKIINLVLNDFTHDSRVLKTSASLQGMGYEITVVAIHSLDLQEQEFFEGVPVHRIKLSSRLWSKIKLFQILKLVEFCIRFIFKYGREQIIHCNDLGGLFVGVMSKTFNWSQKLIYDSHEFAINDIPNQSQLSIKIKYFIERFLIRFSDSVIVVSDSIANEYSRIYQIKKPHIVLNCPSYIDQFKNEIFRKKFGIRKNQIIFLYQGGLSEGRGIEVMLQAFEALSDDRCVLVCMGYGPLVSMVQSYASRQANIFYHPAVKHNLLLDYTSSADFGLLFYEDSCLNHRFCSPNKIFEYLMAGLPVITSNLFEMRRLVETELVGFVADNNSVDGLIRALNCAVNSDVWKIQNNVKRARGKYCWEEQENVLRTVYGQY